jgi:hypothetical protein
MIALRRDGWGALAAFLHRHLARAAGAAAPPCRRHRRRCRRTRAARTRGASSLPCAPLPTYTGSELYPGVRTRPRSECTWGQRYTRGQGCPAWCLAGGAAGGANAHPPAPPERGCSLLMSKPPPAQLAQRATARTQTTRRPGLPESQKLPDCSGTVSRACQCERSRNGSERARPWAHTGVVGPASASWGCDGVSRWVTMTGPVTGSEMKAVRVHACQSGV